jgi:hypothetical protein
MARQKIKAIDGICKVPHLSEHRTAFICLVLFIGKTEQVVWPRFKQTSCPECSKFVLTCNTQSPGNFLRPWLGISPQLYTVLWISRWLGQYAGLHSHQSGFHRTSPHRGSAKSCVGSSCWRQRHKCLGIAGAGMLRWSRKESPSVTANICKLIIFLKSSFYPLQSFAILVLCANSKV